MTNRCVGIDLGKQDDFTAITVADEVPVVGGKSLVHVRYLRRVRHVSYAEQVEQIAAMSGWPSLHGVPFVVDASGVGRAVVDMLVERVRGVEAVTITSGREVTKAGPHEHGVPKRDLVSALEVLSGSHRLKFAPDLVEGPTVLQELQDFGYSISGSGHDSWNARTAHDDLVLSVSLACWWLTRGGHGHAWLEFARRRTADLAQPWEVPR